MSAHGFSHVLPADGGIGQLAPLARTQHSELLENAVPLAVVIKDSWRHKLAHVDNQIVWMDTDFSPQVAEEIIAAVRGFMRKLAQDLPQDNEE